MNEQFTTGNPAQNGDALNEQKLSQAAPPPPKKKRNSGRSGPTSLAGRLRSSRNAIKHGACAETLILPCESEPAFLILLARWCREYHISEAEQALVNNAHCGPCTDHSLTYDFVRRAAEADWHRIRCQRSYDSYSRMYIDGRAPFNWTPAEVKMHDLHLRYKTAADRAFHRENRALQQHLKFQQEQKRWQQQEQEKQNAASPEPAAALKKVPPFTVCAIDPESPTGYSIITEIIDGVEYSNTRPFVPPDPIPAHWPNPANLPRKGDPGSSGS
jgi:hypothetical protein